MIRATSRRTTVNKLCTRNFVQIKSPTRASVELKNFSSAEIAILRDLMHLELGCTLPKWYIQGPDNNRGKETILKCFEPYDNRFLL